MAAVLQFVSQHPREGTLAVAVAILAVGHQCALRLLVEAIPAAAEVTPVAVDTRVEAAVVDLPHPPDEEGVRLTPDTGSSWLQQ
jgi:hypothetical protein